MLPLERKKKHESETVTVNWNTQQCRVSRSYTNDRLGPMRCCSRAISDERSPL